MSSTACASCWRGPDRSLAEPEEPRRIINQHPIARLAVGHIAFEQIHDLEFMVNAVAGVRVLARPDEAMDMWPVGAPHATIRRRLVEHPAERHHVVPRLALLRTQIAVGKANPPVSVLQKVEQHPHHRRRRAIRRDRAAEMIDDRRQFYLPQLTLNRQEVVTEAEHLDEPAEFADAVERTAEAFHAW